VTDAKPITLTIAALGGQGGGVVADWLIHVARRCGYLAQATSVPGVAQRTGATIYYLEFFPASGVPAGKRPIFALMPHPGDVDVVIASEIMEAGRAMQRGLVTGRTTLIASSHRIFAIQEKSHMSDGRVDAGRVRELARQHAGRYVEIDMQAVAEAHGSVISAAMLGALCGSGALPFASGEYVEAIRASGIEAVSSTRAFEAARIAAAGAAPGAVPPMPQDAPSRALSAAWEERIRTRVPAPAQAVAREGVRRLIDYQDSAYANLYLERLEAVAALEPSRDDCPLTLSVARGLALWMSFEDTIRVADLKIRSTRARRVLDEVRPSQGQLVAVTEFMKPRIEELCGTLPARLGRWVLRSKMPRRWLTRLTGGRRIETSSILGFLQLYWLANLRGRRRNTLRYSQEDQRIGRWLAVIAQTAPEDHALAVEIAECQQLIKGYGETHERGTASLNAILTDLFERPRRGAAAARVRALRAAALADEQGEELAKALAAA
jgi:indolepyruvate ferredoxin oxidoreductase beta subunit